MNNQTSDSKTKQYGLHLLIDIGNTSAKIAVADNDRIVHFERREESWDQVFHRLTTAFDIAGCIVSNVAGEDSLLMEALTALPFSVTHLTYMTPNPVNGTNAPLGLGSDRWAADIGAMSIDKLSGKTRPILVIDAGTCITYDFINEEGIIQYGAISPGVQLRIKAMHEHTALLPMIEIGSIRHDDNAEERIEDILGTDTETSLRSGALMGATLEIEGFILHLKKIYPSLHVYVTGGNSFAFSKELKDTITLEPMLIMKGLMMCR